MFVSWKYSTLRNIQSSTLSLSLSLSLETPKDLPTFVVGCYIPHQDSNFYASLDKDKPFANLEDYLAYFKSEGEIIAFDDMNVRTKVSNLMHKNL